MSDSHNAVTDTCTVNSTEHVRMSHGLLTARQIASQPPDLHPLPSSSQSNDHSPDICCWPVSSLLMDEAWNGSAQTCRHARLSFHGIFQFLQLSEFWLRELKLRKFDTSRYVTLCTWVVPVTCRTNCTYPTDLVGVHHQFKWQDVIADSRLSKIAQTRLIKWYIRCHSWKKVPFFFPWENYSEKPHVGGFYMSFNAPEIHTVHWFTSCIPGCITLIFFFYFKLQRTCTIFHAGGWFH
jgi:hypothetical protein